MINTPEKNLGFMALSAILCVATITLSCASTLSPRFPETESYQQTKISDAQRQIVEGGTTLVGKKELLVNGVVYPNDCTGVVRAAYAFASIDLAGHFNQYSGNGVKRIFETLRDRELLYAVRYPEPGDLIFWDNTYDANGNGLADDELTHIGLVISIDISGNIRYLHYNYRFGPVIERMNLANPDSSAQDSEGPINAPLRMRGSPPGPGTNAAQIFRIFGRGHQLPAL